MLNHERLFSFLNSQMSAPPLKGIKVVELAGLAPGKYSHPQTRHTRIDQSPQAPSLVSS
jgi:hypothetical protein